MKKIVLLFALFIAVSVKSQAPQYLNYQGIARDASGTIVTTPIGIKFEILQGSASGSVVYDETNTLSPSSAGVFTAAIGGGTLGSFGPFSGINWSTGPYFIRVSIDPAGGTSYSTVGTSQLLSVPYALYAEKAGNTQTVNISGSGVTGTFPNYTITPSVLTPSTGISISGGTITNTAPNQTVNITGPNVTGAYPSYTITPGALTPSTGISINSGTITNTAPDQTVTLAAAGISSVTGTYPSYTIDVPPPSLGYNTLTNVLTLTQGTAVATTTLVGAGSNTVAMFASGIASVNPVGAGSNFTVSVQTPTFTNVGPTTITGTYPNLVINSPAASTVTAANLQINSPHSASTISANNYSINIVPTSITGSGVTGTYPNYTVNSSPSPTIQINSPNSVGTVAVNNYSITVPTVSITGVGIASVSSTYPSFSVTVPGPSLTVTGNTISITQGTVVSTKTIAASPWSYSSGVLYPINNTTDDKVAIGKNVASSNLDVVNDATSTNLSNPVTSILNANSGFNSSVLDVRNTAGSGAGISVLQNSSAGDGIQIDVVQPTNSGNALQVSQKGSGSAGYFDINNTSNNSNVISASTNGLGNVFYAVNSNSLSSSSLFSGSTNGTSGIYVSNTHPSGIAGSFNSIGTSVYAFNTGAFHTIQSQNTNTSVSAYAGQFTGGVNINGKTNTSTGHALRVLDNGSTDLFSVRNDGNVGVGTASPGAKFEVSPSATFTGNVVAITNPNSANTNAAFYLSSSGSGGAMQILNSNAASSAGNFYNTNASSTSAALIVQNNGPGNSQDIYNVGGGRALSASNTATLPTGFFNNAGNGYAILAQNGSAVASRAGYFIGGLDIMGKTTTNSTFPLVITNSASTNLFTVRDDGNVGINVANPGYRLAVLSTNSTSAIFASNTSAAAIGNSNGVTGLTSSTHSLSAGVVGQTTGANSAGVIGESMSTGPSIFGYKNGGSGNAGRFDILPATNTADAVLALTNGGGAALHAVNGPTVAGSSNAAVWLENGHLKSTQATAPTTSTVSVSGGGVSSATITLAAGSTDVKGTMNAVITTTGIINAANNASFRVNFNKSYTVAPTVVVTAKTDINGMSYFVSNTSATAFTLTVRNSSGTNLTAPGTMTANFNYIVIE